MMKTIGSKEDNAMKKIIITLAAVAAAFSMVSCNKEMVTPEDNPAIGEKTVIFASTEDGMTKTALSGNDTDGYEVVWSTGDSFNIGGETFTLAGEAGKSSGTFEGTVPADGDYTVYYPSTYNGTDWPAAQTYVEGNIAGSPMKAEVTVSGGKVPSLEFKNEGGILRLTVGEESASDEYTIKSVKVSADQLPNSITLDCGTGVELDGSLVFNIAMPAGTYTGVTIKLYTTGPNTCTKSFKGTNGLVIERSKITTASFTANFEYGGLCFTAVEDNASITLLASSLTPKPDMKYSKDGVNWDDVVWAYTTILDVGNVGDKLYLCGENPDGLSQSSSKDFIINASKVAASGNVMSLIDPTCQTDEIPNDYCFYKLFAGSGNTLSAAPELPATTLTANCYYQMFNGCTNLTKAPELPATTVKDYCYYQMFNGCKNLTKAPDLPATTVSKFCYNGMFTNCTSLATAPKVLPATTLAESCYNRMFNGCSALEKAPELPATTLVKGCYGSMFTNCKKLNYIKVHFIDHSATGCLSTWVNGVSSTGTFYKPAGLTDLPTGYAGIPTDWAVVDF